MNRHNAQAGHPVMESKTMAYTIDQFAADCGVSLSDAEGFVAGVSLWVNKGLSLEAAMQQHLSVLAAMLDQTAQATETEYGALRHMPAITRFVADAFYPEEAA